MYTTKSLKDVSEEFLRRVANYRPLKVTQETFAGLSTVIQSMFMEYLAMDIAVIPEIIQDIHVIGAVIEQDRQNPTVLQVRWQTQWLPHQNQWKIRGYDEHCMPLGKYMDMDLYVGFQESLPPTLIAVYGGYMGEYVTYNPALCGILDDSEPNWATVAFDRALLLNVDLRIPDQFTNPYAHVCSNHG